MQEKKSRKKKRIEPGDRLIFQIPDEMIPDFNDLKSVGFGDTEIVVECLRSALVDVKAELLAKRAKDAADLYAKQAHYVKLPQPKTAPQGPRTLPGAQSFVKIQKNHASSPQKKG